MYTSDQNNIIDNNMQAVAYSELARISKSDQHRRAAIYNDIGVDNNNSAWKKISGECMKVIDEVRNTVMAEYRKADVIRKFYPIARLVPRQFMLLDLTTFPNENSITG
jgi:hypothetical protein